MTFSRRKILKTATVASIGGMALAQGIPAFAAPSLPDKSSFGSMSVTYLNSASQHPISLASSRALESYLSKRRIEPGAPGGRHNTSEPLVNFAKIINADVNEVAYVHNTTTAEQMIVAGLGFPDSGGHIITDEFHFPGTEALYNGLGRRGVDVTKIAARNRSILLEDVEAALRPDTKLIALSLISMESGFEHDLRAICDIAHPNGTLVYADIIQAAGALPIDVKESRLDFAACSTYKWLMGDFGTGFIYASRDAQNRLNRTVYGSYDFVGAGETNEIDDDGFPKNASGLFALGTRSFAGEAILTESLPYILDVGVENIHAHNQKLVNRLKDELPEIGVDLHTTKTSKGPYVVAGFPGIGEKIRPALERAAIQISVYENRVRIAPSVFNDVDDIEYLLSTIKNAV